MVGGVRGPPPPSSGGDFCCKTVRSVRLLSVKVPFVGSGCLLRCKRPCRGHLDVLSPVAAVKGIYYSIHSGSGRTVQTLQLIYGRHQDAGLEEIKRSEIDEKLNMNNQLDNWDQQGRLSSIPG